MNNAETFLDEYNSQMPQGGSIPYTVISCLRHGARHAAYLVKLSGDGSEAVLKTGDKESLSQEYANLRLLKNLKEYIAPLPITYWETEDSGYLLREYVPGVTLAQWHDEQDAIDCEELRRIGIAVCGLVSHLHKQNLILRDIKPENFIIDSAGQICLIDVDTLRRFDKCKQQDTNLLGTRGYAAPEQYGFGQTTSRTDVYGFGMLLAALATGQQSEDALHKATLPKWFKRIISKCIHFDPKRRYANMGSVAAALKHPHSHAVIAAATAAAALTLALYFILSSGENLHGAIDSAKYATLQQAVDAVEPWTDARIYLRGDWELDKPLIISRRQITFFGDGVIKDSAAMAGKDLLHIEPDGRLTLEKGAAVWASNGTTVIQNFGEFILNGGEVDAVVPGDKGRLLGNTGTVRLVSGEMTMQGGVDWATINEGSFIMEGGLVVVHGIDDGLLNSGTAYYKGGTIKLYPDNAGYGHPVHDFNGGMSTIDGTMILMDDRLI